MARFGLDYAWTTISVRAHKAIGSSFACRYLSHDPAKNLSLAEAKALRAGGIDIVVVWETTAARALDGEVAGKADAEGALKQAGALGIPAGRPIYFAVDFDETPAEAGAVADYFRGVNAALGVNRTGVYGGHWVVKRLFDAKLVKFGWQTYAWSGGNFDRRAQLYQFSNGHRVDGQSCDFNHAFAADFGQWGYASPPPPKPVPEKRPSGVFRYEVQVNFSTGHWRVQGLPSEGVALGGPDRWASAKGGVNAETGEWVSTQSLTWNAPPLGGK